MYRKADGYSRIISSVFYYWSRYRVTNILKNIYLQTFLWAKEIIILRDTKL